jgi:hypothetical protein
MTQVATAEAITESIATPKMVEPPKAVEPPKTAQPPKTAKSPKPPKTKDLKHSAFENTSAVFQKEIAEFCSVLNTSFLAVLSTFGLVNRAPVIVFQADGKSPREKDPLFTITSEVVYMPQKNIPAKKVNINLHLILEKINEKANVEPYILQAMIDLAIRLVNLWNGRHPLTRTGDVMKWIQNVIGIQYTPKRGSEIEFNTDNSNYQKLLKSCGLDKLKFQLLMKGFDTAKAANARKAAKSFTYKCPECGVTIKVFGEKALELDSVICFYCKSEARITSQAAKSTANDTMSEVICSDVLLDKMGVLK